MAKESDRLAGSLDADKAGMLSGLLAEENEFDRHSLWRIGTWGVAAVGAVVLAVAANQSAVGWRREQLAAVDIARQSQQIQSLAKESQNETRRLASAIDTLNGDRDRLFSRVTVIEQGLDSVTGTIARQGAAANTASLVPAPPKPMPPASAMPGMITAPPVATGDIGPPAPPQNQAAVPLVAPVTTTTVAAAPEKPRTEAAKSDPAPENPSLPQIASNKPNAPAPAGNSSAPASGAQAAAAIAAGKSMMGPPDPGAPKMLEPAKTANAVTANTATTYAAPIATTVAPAPGSDASAAAAAPKDQEKPVLDADAAKATIQRTEFAVELGGANSIGGLRALWRGLLKSNNAELAELRPIIMLREGNSGLGMQLRLAAGPLHDAAEAAKICAALVESARNCETTVFDGQRLAMGDEAQPGADGKQPPAAASGKPTGGKRYLPKHSKKEDPSPPPKETSTFSSLFGMGKR